MVVPYQHVDRLDLLPAEAATEMIALAQRMETVLRELYHPDGINLGMNIGKAAGAGVAGHIHMHILPRWVADANFMSVIGETRVLPESPGRNRAPHPPGARTVAKSPRSRAHRPAWGACVFSPCGGRSDRRPARPRQAGSGALHQLFHGLRRVLFGGAQHHLGCRHRIFLRVVMAEADPELTRQRIQRMPWKLRPAPARQRQLHTNCIFSHHTS